MLLKHIIILPFLFSSLFAQKGLIKIRKANSNLIEKTLQLNDLRNNYAGTIKFTTDTNCLIHFKIDFKSPIAKEDYSKLIPLERKINCSYSILNDTLLTINYKNYTDTCNYSYLNDSMNIVKLNNTLHGVYSQSKEFIIFYSFDSIIYSQTYNKILTDSAFNKTINLDSIYKDIKDKKIRETLEKELKKELEIHSKNLTYNYFRGKFKIINNKINLIKNNNHFANLIINKKNKITITSQYTMDGSLSLKSNYLSGQYGFIQLKYDTAYVNHYIKEFENDSIKTKNIISSYYLIKHTKLNTIKLYNNNDTLIFYKNLFFNYVKIKGVIGGYADAYLKSLNGKILKLNKLHFTHKGAYEVNQKYQRVDSSIWNYTLTDSALFLYNKTDTLVDERSLFFNRIFFTYKNNNSIVFGTYHHKTKKGKHEFIILYNNHTGVKYTNTIFNYKEARLSLKQNTANILTSQNIKQFNFLATKEYLWLTFNDGSYEKLSFFNFNKAIRDSNDTESKNYYLIE